MSQSWQDRCREAAALFDQGEHARAAEIFEEIVTDESLVQSDRAMMYLNLATAYDKLGSKLKVMKAYEKAAERALHLFVYVETARAQWLLSSGQANEAVAAMERMLTLPLAAEQRKRAEENLRTARKHAG